LLLAALGAIGLILFAAFVASRLMRARTSGMSIRLQVFLALAIVVGAFAFGLGLLVLNRIEARATLLAEGAARDEAAAIAALIESEMDSRGVGLHDVARKLDQARGQGPQALHLTLLDADKVAVFSSGPSDGDPGTVAVIAPIWMHGKEVGHVRVVKPTLVIRKVLADFAPTILVISAVLGAAAAASAALIGRAIAKPIEALTDFAVAVSEGERRVPPPPVYGREVQKLSRAIDSMRRELTGRPFVETFAADLSHELKNPVAAIRASAEVLADGALDEPEQAARFVHRIQQATSRIELLLGDLLSLARIEARGVEQAGIVDLSDLAQAAATRAREHGSTVEVVAPVSSRVRGDLLWLTRALDNLLDNARMHGEAGQPIRLIIARAAAQTTLSVQSRGKVGAHVQKRLFRRFVTTREGHGGTGLGLAIVRAIAEAHSGWAECTAVGPPVVEFRITLPGA
jgi:signal transduction histidine kinase